MGKKRILLISAFTIVVIICFKLLFCLHLDPSDENFTQSYLCPACYGQNLCPQFYHKDISLIGVSKFRYIKSAKNVFSGKFLRERVIMKKLAHDSEITDTDILLCKKAKLSSCKVKEAIQILVRPSFSISIERNLFNVIRLFNESTDLVRCPSERLISYIYKSVNHKQSDADKENSEVMKLGEVLYGIIINPEVVIIQAFPQSEGWPFPKYYGSCGRVIVEEYVGWTIAYYEDSSWEQRLSIAYQLLLIAQTLTENGSGFAMYLTDVNMDNFALRSDGTVLLIDVENIVMVDRLKTIKDTQFKSKLHHSNGEHCKDCLNFSFEDLCSYEKSDHNYYAICKGLLIPGSYYSAKGILHDIPEDINAQTNLESLIQDCANPSKLYGRFQVVPKILQVMKSLL